MLLYKEEWQAQCLLSAVRAQFIEAEKRNGRKRFYALGNPETPPEDHPGCRAGTDHGCRMAGAGLRLASLRIRILRRIEPVATSGRLFLFPLTFLHFICYSSRHKTSLFDS